MKLEYFDFICESLRNDLEHDRYCHTIGVALTAAALAMRYRFDSPDRAQIAGLLHDCAKCIPNEDKYALCNEFGVYLNDFELKNPSLVHAKLGAEIASNKFGVFDRDILDAIRTHTTGAPNMSLLQKIIYVADFIEPNRDDIIPHIESIQSLAFEDLDRAVYEISGYSIDYLNKSGKEIDPATIATHNFYKNKIEGN